MSRSSLHEAHSILRVYSKPDCPLCDELKDELNRRKIGFVERSIMDSEDWFRRYQIRVPVVVSAGGREFDPPFSEGDYGAWSRESG